MRAGSSRQSASPTTRRRHSDTAESRKADTTTVHGPPCPASFVTTAMRTSRTTRRRDGSSIFEVRPDARENLSPWAAVRSTYPFPYHDATGWKHRENFKAYYQQFVGQWEMEQQQQAMMTAHEQQMQHLHHTLHQIQQAGGVGGGGAPGQHPGMMMQPPAGYPGGLPPPVNLAPGLPPPPMFRPPPMFQPPPAFQTGMVPPSAAAAQAGGNGSN